MNTTTIASMFALAAIAGCAEEMTPGSLVERPRVLGARVEAAGDALRAWPAPGEDLTITWLVTAPEADPPHAWQLVACVATAAGDDCAQPPFALIEGAGDTPVAQLTAPAAGTLGDATSLLVAGVICANGTPRLDGDHPTCTGDATQTTVLLSVPLWISGEPNRHPALTADGASFDGAPWPALATPPADGCAAIAASPELPHVLIAAGDPPELPIVWTTTDADRESDGDTRETLQLSSFATSGELSSQFSFIEAADTRPAPTAELSWTAPELADIPATGLAVRFTFVLRDGRGGVAVATRALCAVRP